MIRAEKFKLVGKDLALIVLGCAVFAAGVDCFLAPNGLTVGGVTGLATVVSAFAARFGITLPIGAQTIAINTLLMLLVARSGNKHYFIRIVLGAALSGFFIDFFSSFLPVLGDDDLLLSALWGGVVSGAGLGLVMRGGGNTGGSDIIAQFVNKRFGIPVGTTFIATDVFVIAVSMLVFSPKNALYALITIVISGRVCDAVLDGPRSQRAAYIISNEYEKIAHEILYTLDRGCTELYAKGSWSGEDKSVLFCVLSRSETALLKTIVGACDPHAIVIISEVYEAFGEGFKQLDI